MEINTETKAAFSSRSVAETLALGERLGRAAQPGNVLALFGELGAGKTVLTKGILAGLGGNADEVTSPTFVLMTRHEARIPLYHFDAYRLGGFRDMLEIGAEEVLYAQGISVVEWAERVSEALPADRLEVRMEIAGEDQRRILMRATGPRSESWLQRAEMVEVGPA